ncbi:MAG TPA: 50S ribosomal protein L9 [Actinomycetota bacterium]|jgi:large subunit ribosomal protein L9|nr:50S ribosomal protein L9 [Actinomycetota bacterium]HYN98933.1 50S ribosomal protein L9 [Actinomycetota bacterium]
MKVILSQDMSNLGHKGDVVEVKDGYARNFLLPTNRAFRASKGSLKQAETMQRARAAQEAKDKAQWTALAGRIGGVRLVTKATAGAEGQLFGSVTTSDIAELLTAQLGEEIDRRKVILPEPIKSVGSHVYKVHLHADVVAEGNIDVQADGVAPAFDAEA